MMESFKGVNKSCLESYVQLLAYAKLVKQRYESFDNLDEKHKDFQQSQKNLTEELTIAAKLLSISQDREAIKRISQNLIAVRDIQYLSGEVSSTENRIADAGARSVTQETVAELKANSCEDGPFASINRLALPKVKEFLVKLDTAWDEARKVEYKAFRSIPFVVSTTLDNIIASTEGNIRVDSN